MSSRSRNDSAGKHAAPGGMEPNRATTRPPGGGPVPRVRSHELLRDSEQLIIEHAGREYRLRVTSNGKLILTA
jgi:hemin uptake protein HemP